MRKRKSCLCLDYKIKYYTMYIYRPIIYVTAWKVALSGPQSHHLNYTTRCITWHRAPDMYIRFWKWVFFPRTGLFNRGNTWVRQSVARPLASWSACLCLTFCKFVADASRFLVGAMRPLAPLWLRACPLYIKLSWALRCCGLKKYREIWRLPEIEIGSLVTVR